VVLGDPLVEDPLTVEGFGRQSWKRGIQCGIGVLRGVDDGDLREEMESRFSQRADLPRDLVKKRSFLPENSYPGLCRSLRKLPVQSRQWRPKAHGKFQIGGIIGG
jgi:hypothetical protein